jgi:ketosteroid isomerase-like protein
MQTEVWAFVQTLNQVWTVERAPEKLVAYFAPDMIAITPTDQTRREGQADCVAGWTDFVRAATIQRWVERNPMVLMLAGGNAAVVAYDFEIEFTMGGHPVVMHGRDLMTLEKRANRWWLVADHYSPTPGAP